MLEKDFKLSKTEFVAYLRCPMLFYLKKELKEKSSTLPRIERSDYEPFLQEGMKISYRKLERILQG